MAGKERIDNFLARTGKAQSRSQAQRLVMAGQVRVDGEMVFKSSHIVPEGSRVEVFSGPKYVSRGGEKLEGAFEDFPIKVEGKICADIGASTGGFTDCLLQHGAARVYAIDVGHGILDWKLRTDDRVVVMERTNARYLEELPESVSMVTVDASFISLRLLLPRAVQWLAPDGDIIALVKPQFEAGKELVGHGGVVRSTDVHRQVVDEMISFLPGIGLFPAGLSVSPLRGPKGNIEFLLWCNRVPDTILTEVDIDRIFSSLN
ncbi:MAG: TlyA family RNA methyltransferase [Anaerolineales bacterium]|nr:TlyA family RNA methyltransferase [Anaerolineales bacterium]